MTERDKSMFLAEIGYLRGMLSGAAIVDTMLKQSISFEGVCKEMIESVDKIGMTVLGEEYNEIFKKDA